MEGLANPHSTAMVDHYCFHLVDDDFGPFFVKFCSYFPYTARLCVNGHEYVKRQLARRGVAFEALDNGILSCADPALAQELADPLTAERIDDLGLRGSSACRTRSRATTAPPASATRSPCCLPEFAPAQVLDRPAQGRVFFEETIRENLDLGRPDRAQPTLLAFRLLPEGFANREFREHVGPLLAEGDYGPNRATYDLGRLRMRGLVERIPRTRRYRVAAHGHRVALCSCRTHRRPPSRDERRRDV